LGARHAAGVTLIEGQQDAVLAWIKIQEDAGIEIISAGAALLRMQLGD